MRELRRVLIRLAGYFGAAWREREWNAEFEAHLQLHIEDNLRAGMSVEEARSEALLKFGGMETVKESMRDSSGFAWLDVILRDLRYSLRGLQRSPGFAVTTILSLTLGLGASLAVFTVADNLLVRPLPYRDASRLVLVWEANTKIEVAEHNPVAPTITWIGSLRMTSSKAWPPRRRFSWRCWWKLAARRNSKRRA